MERSWEEYVCLQCQVSASNEALLKDGKPKEDGREGMEEKED